MSQQAVLDFHPEPVERSLAKEASTARTLQENFTSCHDTISDVAALLDTGDKLEACKAALREVLELEAEVRAFAGALDSLGQTYRPSLDATNFSEQLQQHKALAEQRCPYIAEEDPVYTDLLKELQARDGEGAEAAMDEEEGLVMDNTQQQLATNAKCPLSGKPILELQDPVEDEMGYVYDKASILQYIRRELQRHPGREVQCPVAATAHTISAGKLRPARRVLREQKRLRRGGATQAEDDADDIIDV